MCIRNKFQLVKRLEHTCISNCIYKGEPGVTKPHIHFSMSARSWHQRTRTQPRPAILRNSEVTVLALCTAISCIVQLTARPPRDFQMVCLSKILKVLCYPMHPDFRNNCFLKPSWLCPHALLIRITHRWRRVWTIGGMKLTADSSSSRRKTFPSVTLPITNLKRTGTGSNPVFLCGEHCCIIVEDPVRTAQ